MGNKTNIWETIAPSFALMGGLVHHNVVHLLQLDSSLSLSLSLYVSLSLSLFMCVCVCQVCRWRLVSFQLTELKHSWLIIYKGKRAQVREQHIFMLQGCDRWDRVGAERRRVCVFAHARVHSLTTTSLSTMFSVCVRSCVRAFYL